MLILHTTMIPQPLLRTEKLLAQVNAIQNGVSTVGRPGCGLHGGLGGESIIVDPGGLAVEQLFMLLRDTRKPRKGRGLGEAIPAGGPTANFSKQ